MKKGNNAQNKQVMSTNSAHKTLIVLTNSHFLTANCKTSVDINRKIFYTFIKNTGGGLRNQRDQSGSVSLEWRFGTIFVAPGGDRDLKRP